VRVLLENHAVDASATQKKSNVSVSLDVLAFVLNPSRIVTETLNIRSVRSEYSFTSLHRDILEVRDSSTGLHAFIALHDLTRGPGFGGIRRMAYDSLEDAARDACQLATQMTTKTRFAGLACGGAKSVIIDAPGLDLNTVYSQFAQAVERLDGQYICGPDVGTGVAEMNIIREVTAYANAPENNPSISTAHGVLAGIRAALDHRFGVGSEREVSAFVHGVGRVGALVAEGLGSIAREVVIADVNRAHLRSVQERIGSASRVIVVPPKSASYDYWPGTVFSPCAIGPVICESNVDTLGCQVICGSANTQLETESLVDALHQRGILYIPDFVVNAGAVIEGAVRYFSDEDEAETRATINEAIGRIEERVAALLKLASVRHDAPLRVIPDFLSSI